MTDWPGEDGKSRIDGWREMESPIKVEGASLKSEKEWSERRSEKEGGTLEEVEERETEREGGKRQDSMGIESRVLGGGCGVGMTVGIQDTGAQPRLEGPSLDPILGNKVTINRFFLAGSTRDEGRGPPVITIKSDQSKSQRLLIGARKKE
ncbi:hypothetical protein BJY04DRAFT_168583 [Aspergillus karnatakaensis]|uniref:uncharacterized protein n=1 Tax=Aspergillus karnatakaensis TaxID=1810916 RepID=UPI003CCDAE5E